MRHPMLKGLRFSKEKVIFVYSHLIYYCIRRKSNLNIIEKCSGDDEMLLAMMDDRENQNPNQLKKSQSIQADELKKLSLNKVENQSNTKNLQCSALSNEATSKAAKHFVSDKIVKENTNSKATVKSEPVEEVSEVATKKSKPSGEEANKADETKPAVVVAAPTNAAPKTAAAKKVNFNIMTNS